MKKRTRSERLMRGAAALAVCVGFVAYAALIACAVAGVPQKPGERTTLSLTLALALGSSRTLVPAVDMKPASFSIACSGPGGSSAEATCSETSVLVENLVAGEWTIAVSAWNGAGVMIGEGEATVELVADAPNELTVRVGPVAGNGALELSALWPAALAVDASIEAALTPAAGEPIPLNFVLDGASAACSRTDLAAGYYALDLCLLDSGTVVTGTSDVVRILAGQTTTGTFDFGSVTPGAGSAQLAILPQLCDPVVVSVGGRQAELGAGRALLLKSWPLDASLSLRCRWSIDGVPRSTDDPALLGSGLRVGVHRIDLVARTADLARAGSAGFLLRVLPALPFGALSSSELIRDGENGVDGLGGCRAVCVSADGASLYAAGAADSAVAWFGRDPDVGALRFCARYKNGSDGVQGVGGAEALALAPDGARLYVAGYSDGAIAQFRRDGSGALTFERCYRSTDEGLAGLAGAKSIALSPDGRNLYCVGYAQGTIVAFARDPSTGALSAVQTLRDGEAGVTLLAGASSVAVTPDGEQVAVASYTADSLVVFNRDASTGLLTLGCAFADGAAGCDGLNGASGVCVSPDGTSLCVASYYDHAVALFARTPSSGSIAFSTYFKDGAGGVEGLSYARGCAFSADGRTLYATGSGDDSVAAFARDPATGALSYLSSCGGFDGARGVVLSPDGRNCYLGCANSNAVAVLNRVQE